MKKKAWPLLTGSSGAAQAKFRGRLTPHLREVMLSASSLWHTSTGESTSTATFRRVEDISCGSARRPMRRQLQGRVGCYAELGRPSYSRQVFRDARVNVEIARLAVGNSIVAQQTLACETAALKQNDGGLIRDHDNRLNSAKLEFSESPGQHGVYRLAHDAEAPEARGQVVD